MPTPPPPHSLLERLHRTLREEGTAPSRRRLALLIEAGAARVDGRVVRTPEASIPDGARVVLDLDDVDPEALRARPAKARAAPLPTGFYAADAWLVVVERSALPAEAGAVAPAAATLLGRTRLWPVHDPSAPGSGPVVLAGSAEAARRIQAAIEDGRVTETLLSVRSPAQPGAHEALLERREGDAGPFGLLRREDAPLAAAPLGARHLVAPQRLALALKHPRTNRRLMLEVEPAPTFLAALRELDLGG